MERNGQKQIYNQFITIHKAKKKSYHTRIEGAKRAG
jgi:hypothetical protein